MESTRALPSVDARALSSERPDAAPQTPSASRFRRALGFLGPHRFTVAIILVLALVLAALSAFEPLVLKYLFDRLEAGRDAKSALALGLAGLVLMGLSREGAQALSNALTWRTRININYALTEATVSRLHRLPMSFHRKEGVGALMTRLDRGIQGFVGALTEIAFNFIPAVVYLVITVVVLIRLEWRLALVILAFAPLPAIVGAFAAPMQTRRERNLLERWTSLYARFNEVLSGILTVKSFAMEEAEKQRFLHGHREANAVVIRGVRVDAFLSAAQNLAVTAARIAAIGYGGWLLLQGNLSLGTLVAVLGYVGGLFTPVQGLTGIYKTLRTASVSLDQVFAILDAQDTLGDAPDARDVPTVRGELRFENVRFSYEPGSEPLIDGIDLTIPAGQLVALVGPSGAGKTTLMALLQRFYDPTEGTVRVDGHDVRQLRQIALRRHVGVVLQDALLFNESVRANIAYGKPGASLEEIERVAVAANAHEFISRLPQGYDTVVGERGCRLSGGERQRLAIARALLKDPAVLILDEPTSALDSESEALVQQALNRLVRGRTTIAIAHRLSTVVESDRILVLRKGRVEEDGTHEELMKRGGYYASLVGRQTRGLTGLRAVEAAPGS